MLGCCRAALQTNNNRFAIYFHLDSHELQYFSICAWLLLRGAPKNYRCVIHVRWSPMNSDTFPCVLGCCHTALQTKNNGSVIDFLWIPKLWYAKGFRASCSKRSRRMNGLWAEPSIPYEFIRVMIIIFIPCLNTSKIVTPIAGNCRFYKTCERDNKTPIWGHH